MKSIGKKMLAWVLSLLLITGCCLVAGVPKDTVSAADTYTSGDYIYTLLDDGTAEIVSYNGPGGNLVLPETLDGYPVTSIGNSAFEENQDLTGVVIPANITSVGYAAFSNCDNLVSVEFLGENVTMISQCFVDCDSLRDVTLPSKQEEIGWGLFFNCRSLEHITLPDTVTTIEDSAFYYSGLKELIVPASVESLMYSALGGCTQLETVCFLGNTWVDSGLFASFAGSVPHPVVYLQADSFALSVAQQAGWNYRILPATGLPFMDIASSGVYYTEAVQYVYENGLMTGMNATTFGPSQTLSRAQFAVILYRMAGSPSVAGMDNPFADNQQGMFYHDAVIWCNNVGIITGYYNADGSFTGRFGPSDRITREQLATMLYRYANYAEMDTSASISLDDFGDGSRVSAFAAQALQWAAAEGIVSGRQTNPPTIAPQDSASRADTAVMLQRFLV